MKYIPNENSWVGFCAAITGTLAAPKLADITASIDLTKLVMGITASTTGQAVPTPTFDTKFETSIGGTVSASFSLDGYRDDVAGNDVLWSTLPRGTVGTIFIARHGGKPVVGKPVESWPIEVLSRSVPNMTSNTVVSSTITCSNPAEPEEDAVVVT